MNAGYHTDVRSLWQSFVKSNAERKSLEAFAVLMHFVSDHLTVISRLNEGMRVWDFA